MKLANIIVRQQSAFSGQEFDLLATRLGTQFTLLDTAFKVIEVDIPAQCVVGGWTLSA